MRRIAVVVSLALFVAIPFTIAAAKKAFGPSAEQIAAAHARAEYSKDDAVTFKFPSGKKVTFIPANIGHADWDDRAKGVIIGKLESDRKTFDGLEPGMYLAYLCRIEGKWHVYYTEKDHAVGEASFFDDGLDNDHKPSFVDNGTKIRYGKMKFSY